MKHMRLGRDRRRFKRYDVDGIRGRVANLRDLVVRDLSLTGLAVESSGPLRVGDSSTLEMRGALDGVDMPVEVMWSRLMEVRHLKSGGMENVYRAGLDFSGALDEKAQEILGFIEGHVIIDLDRKLRGRFRNGCASTTLARPRDFRVKRICFSGMLIESCAPCSPEPDSVLEIAVVDDTLALECAARVAHVQPVKGCAHHEVHLDFQDLSIDDTLALDYFIRHELE